MANEAEGKQLHTPEQSKFIAFARVLGICLEHVEELRSAWERGCISECDGLGGTRSNRNYDVHQMLWRTIREDDPETALASYRKHWPERMPEGK